MVEPITFVSLGPGDPELITLKGLRALQGADVVYVPATLGGGGELLSRARDIVVALGIAPSKVECFVVPMSRQREATLKAYADLAEAARCRALQGGRVTITAEGDAGFYSSAQYIEERLWELGSATERIAGVPAFVDCARLVGTHLVNQDSSFEVLARVDSAQVLRAAMAQDKSIVLMKISQWEQAIKEVLSGAAVGVGHTFHYVESCGVEGREFSTSDVDTILGRKFPYFAILIIKQRRA